MSDWLKARLLELTPEILERTSGEYKRLIQFPNQKFVWARTERHAKQIEEIRNQLAEHNG